MNNLALHNVSLHLFLSSIFYTNKVMVEFLTQNDYMLPVQSRYAKWVEHVIESEKKICGDISYTFCNDADLDKLNQHYLNHVDYTDIISFDATVGDIISGEIFISTERVAENAKKFGVSFDEELLRVLAHGLLHYCGYNDKTPEQSTEMRLKEAEKMKLFHVEQL